MNAWKLSAVVVCALSVVAAIAKADQIYWVELDFEEVQRVNLDGTGFEQVLGQGDFANKPHSIAFDLPRGKMYVTDGNRIQKADLDGANLETPIFEPGLFSGIAVDSLGEKVYWCNFFQFKIQRANLDGSNVQDLVTGLARPESITLDVAGGKIYWTDRDASPPRIQRANLDGTSAEDLVTGLARPTGIDLDVAAGMMYWADETDDTIQRAGMELPDGETASTRTDIETIVRAAAAPQGIALDTSRGHVYWVAQNTLKIRRADLDGGNEMDITATEDGVPLGIALELANTSAIPTVSEWGLIVLTLLLLTAGTIVFRRARLAKAAA